VPGHSRVLCLPCREDTIRGFAHVDLLLLDEAALVPDDLYRAVRPILAVSNGRLIALSTPRGKRGFFWRAWTRNEEDWQRVEVPASRVPRITPEFLEEERRALGETWYRQEYCCGFEAPERLVYPDFARCVVPGPAPTEGRRLGGIDFGFRNPFAAIWGVLDCDGVLWLTGEHYARQQPLSYHVLYLPREVLWYADPSGATERAELACADFKVRAGVNALASGIAAVTTRLHRGTLRVEQGCCPNLLHEAQLYRYGTESQERRSEVPVDTANHALAALRYLIATLDQHRQARQPDGPPRDAEPPQRGLDRWLRLNNEAIWTRLV
jgi:hypothetical protein